MNNSIGSFDHFSFRDEQVDDSETENDQISSEDEEIPNKDPDQSQPKTKGPPIKKSILCDEEFVPMTKKVTTKDNNEAPYLTLNHTSDDPEKTSVQKDSKKKQTKKTPKTTKSSKPTKKSKASPDRPPPPAKKTGRKTTSQKSSLKTEQPETSPEVVIPKQSKTRVTKKKPSLKKTRRSEVTEDIKLQKKLQLINWISSAI